MENLQTFLSVVHFPMSHKVYLSLIVLELCSTTEHDLHFTFESLLKIHRLIPPVLQSEVNAYMDKIMFCSLIDHIVIPEASRKSVFREMGGWLREERADNT